MDIGTNSLLHMGLKNGKRSKIKVPTKRQNGHFLQSTYDNLRCVKKCHFVSLQTLLRLTVRLFTTRVKVAFYSLSVRLFTTSVKITFYSLSVRLFTTCVKIAFYSLSIRLFTTSVKIAFYGVSVRLFTTCAKIAFYSLSPESLRNTVLMRKDGLYECVKTYVKKRTEDPYAFFTPSLRTRKFNFSCCENPLPREKIYTQFSDL